MIEIKGSCNSAIVYTDAMEPGAYEQIKAICSLPEYAESRIRVMPDVHVGVGSTIGMTMTIGDKIAPNLVGVDIGCGMETVELAQREIDFAALDAVIHQYVPSGRNVRQESHALASDIYPELLKLRTVKQANLQRALLSVGTLGGGNHFIEVDRAEDGTLYLVVHSGSRHLGLEIANLYQREAYADLHKRDKSIRKDLAFASGELFDGYINDMVIATEFARTNRQAMVSEIVKQMGLSIVSSFTTIHNYIDTQTMTLRKGAVSARAGEQLLIPFNMRDGSLICVGKGNVEWNQSAPHGAGRIMGRKAAKEALSMDEYTASMRDIYTTSVNPDTLDEAPMAYKQMEAITAFLEPSAEIVQTIKPVYNFKARE